LNEPKTRDANDIDSEKRRILEEGSVVTLTQTWSEEVVQHTLNGTREVLMKDHLGEPLSRKKVYFTKNNGQRNILNELGIRQKPDWCVYQRQQEDDEPVTNIVPGDCKSAKKWKSEWINSDSKRLKKAARRVTQQITKYMFLGNTRYGFVISEEELVLVRLSKFYSTSTTDTQVRAGKD
jgi:hypothetical protein